MFITIGELSSNSLNPVHGEGELINVTGVGVVEFYCYWDMEMKPKVIDYTMQRGKIIYSQDVKLKENSSKSQLMISKRQSTK